MDRQVSLRRRGTDLVVGIAPPEVSEDEYLIESDSDDVQERCIPFMSSLYDSDDEVPLSDIKGRAESLIPDSPVDKPNRDNIIWSDDDDLPVASFMESAHKASTSLLWKDMYPKVHRSKSLILEALVSHMEMF
nr:unnamed protein product [Callosobruchus chinensis]